MMIYVRDRASSYVSYKCVCMYVIIIIIPSGAYTVWGSALVLYVGSIYAVKV
jgi:hypothetical protein